MNKPKFTPGPWFVDHGVPGKPRIFSRADNLIKSMVCACEHGALSRQEHDAALIAAAPEMLKELERHCAICMMMHPDCEACELCGTRKVLKKARGEE